MTDLEPEVCCEGRYLCDKCKAEAAAHGIRLAAHKEWRVTRRWVPVHPSPRSAAHRTTTQPKPTLAHGPRTTPVPYIQQPPPDGYKLAIERGTPRTYTSDDPLDGYAAALRKRNEGRK